jgi:hypothetical protein
MFGYATTIRTLSQGRAGYSLEPGTTTRSRETSRTRSSRSPGARWLRSSRHSNAGITQKATAEAVAFCCGFAARELLARKLVKEDFAVSARK